MSLSKRVGRLETANPTKTTVIVLAPEDRKNAPSKGAMEKMAKQAGGVGPFKLWVMHDPNQVEPQVAFIGAIQDLLDCIAKNGCRIGEAHT